MNAYSSVMDRLRSTFSSGKTKDIKFRKKQLEALLKMFEENRDEICSVLNADLRFVCWLRFFLNDLINFWGIFRRPKQEAVLFEIDVMTNEILHLLAHMDEWSAPSKVREFNFEFFIYSTQSSSYKIRFWSVLDYLKIEFAYHKPQRAIFAWILNWIP